MNALVNNLLDQFINLSNLYPCQLSARKEKDAHKTLMKADNLVKEIIKIGDIMVLNKLINRDNVNEKFMAAACLLQYDNYRDIAIKAAREIIESISSENVLRPMAGMLVRIGESEKARNM